MPSKRQDEIKRITSKKYKSIKPGQNILSRKMAVFWKTQIELLDRAQQPWIKRGNDIIKRYRDQRSKTEESVFRRMNLLWTNVKIMKPAVYSKRPTPIVERKFLTRDPVARLSATMLEKALRSEIEVNSFHDTMNRNVLDYLLIGRGIPWVRYEPEIGTSDSLYVGTAGYEDDLNDIEEEFDVDEPEDDEEENQLESTGSRVISESVPIDYVDWRDIILLPVTARTWDEVQAVGKRIFISKHEAIERFGEEIGSRMRPDTVPEGTDQSRLQLDMTAFQDINDRNIQCYEIWNKTDRRVYWLSSGYDFLCDVLDDPLKLKNFFPVPKPLISTYTNDSIQPVADYREWQDQAIQIDELTQRIALLSKACKVAGTYDASNGALKRLLNESLENELVPVDSWAAHAEKGGVQGCISFLPIKEIQEVLKTLVDVRQQIKQDLDEVTGLSDVLRGTTDSRETLGGLRLKNNNAGTRLDERKNEVADHAKNLIVLMSEIICRHFSDETIIKMSGVLHYDEMQPENLLSEFRTEVEYKLSQNPQFQQLMSQPEPEPQVDPMSGQQLPMPPSPKQIFMQQLQQEINSVTPEMLIEKKINGALKLLRDEISLGYRIDIETDSTIWADQAQERMDATEFITAVTKFMSTAMEMGAQLPQSIPLSGKMLQFGVRKFRTGRDLESAIDEFVQQMDKKAKQMENAPPPPSPEEQKAQAEINKINMEADLAKQNDERQAEIERRRQEREFQIQQQNDQRDMQRQTLEDQRNAEMIRLEMDKMRQTHAIEMEALRNNMIAETQSHTYKMREIEANHQAKMAQAKMAKNKPQPSQKKKA